MSLLLFETTEWLIVSSVFHCCCFLLITGLFGVNYHRHRRAAKAKKLSSSLFNLTYISMGLFAFVPLLMVIRVVFMSMSTFAFENSDKSLTIIETSTNGVTYIAMLLYSLGQFVTYLIAVKRLQIVLYGTCFQFEY